MGLLDRLQVSGRSSASTSSTIAGSPFEIWGRGWANADIVGESFHAKAIRSLLGPTKLPSDGLELVTEVRLVHNGRNRQDPNAIEVHGSAGLLGHLSREDAARYVGIIDQLQRQGLIAMTMARIWGRDEKDWNSGKPVFFGSVRIDLPEPHMLVPRNQPPAEPYQLLPSGAAVRVSGVDGSTAATTPYLCREGECWVHATLHEVLEHGPRSSKQLAEVRIDGRPVGRLTPKMSSEMLPAVEFLAQRGFLTDVRAVVKGNQLKCEVILHAKRASELAQEWMNAVPAIAQPAASATKEPRIDTTPARTSPEWQAPPDAESSSAAELSAAPPAWYPDPYGVARLRWWDGTTWTQHTAP